MPALTKTAIERAKPREKPYKLKGERGLYLLVTPGNAKLWRLRFRLGHVQKAGKLVSRERMMGLGQWPDIDLATAEERRDEARKQIARGVDPVAARQAEKLKQADTFESIAREWLANQKPGLSASTYERAEWMLEKLTFPWIGAEPMVTLTRTDIVNRVLKRIEDRRKYVTARRTLQRIASVVEYAMLSDRGPAKGDITAGVAKLLVKPPKAKNHASIKDPAAIGQLLRDIDDYNGHGVTLYALKLAPYLFVRPGELRQMEWAEVALDGPEPVWTIPAEKMKARRPHIVPLPTQAVALLRELYALTGPSPRRKARYVFPAMTTSLRPMSENTLNTAIRRLGYDNTQMTAHGFRSMASTRLNEGFDGHVFNKDWIEAQQAHGDADAIRATYNHASYLPQRRAMMQHYADYLDSLRAAPT